MMVMASQSTTTTKRRSEMSKSIVIPFSMPRPGRLGNAQRLQYRTGLVRSFGGQVIPRGNRTGIAGVMIGNYLRD